MIIENINKAAALCNVSAQAARESLQPEGEWYFLINEDGSLVGDWEYKLLVHISNQVKEACVDKLENQAEGVE